MYNNKKIKGAAQDGLREFISLLISIYIDSIKLLLALIYKGKSKDLQDTWLEDLNKWQEAFFTLSVNSQLSNTFSLAYLLDVFEPYTRPKVGRRRRLLIMPLIVY